MSIDDVVVHVNDIRMRTIAYFQIIAAVTVLSASATGQATRTSAEPSSPNLRFEVASIKVSAAQTAGGLTRTFPGGRFVATNASLRMLLRVAYAVPEYGIVAGPPWIDSARYDIDARPSAEATTQQVRAMVAELLTDRFGLRAHHEERDGPVYELRIVNIKKLRRAPDSADDDKKGPSDSRELTMPAIAANLSRLATIGRPVLDRTSVDGRYRVPSSLFTAKATDTPDAPSIFTRLRDEGLELRPTRAATAVLVVDAATHPTPD